MAEAAQPDGPTDAVRSKPCRLLTPSLTAPGSFALPVLLAGELVGAPEVLASAGGEGGLRAPVVPWFMVPSFIAGT